MEKTEMTTEMAVEEQEIGRSVLAQLVDTEGNILGNTALALPSDTTPEQLSLLLQELIKEVGRLSSLIKKRQF